MSQNKFMVLKKTMKKMMMKEMEMMTRMKKRKKRKKKKNTVIMVLKVLVSTIKNLTINQNGEVRMRFLISRLVIDSS